MNAILLLAAMVAGQNPCDNGICYSPERPYYVIKTYSINHDGRTFDVKGYMVDGLVKWEPSDPRNAASYAAAKARNATPVVPAVRPERKPIAKPGPTLEPAGDDKEIGQVAGQAPNYGLEPGRMKRTPTYTLPSVEARRFVQEAKEGSTVGKLHVTVIGSDDNRAPVVNDLMTHPAFAAIKPTLMIQDYTPDEWPVDPSLGFVTTGKPTILVQEARGAGDPKGGKVVYRASDYSMGPEALAEAIRKASPDYKPSADPGPSTGKPTVASCPFGFTRDHWPHIVVVTIGTFFLHRLPRKGG